MRLVLIATTTLMAVSEIYSATIPVSQLNQIVAFGDSTTDNGNAAIALGGTLPGNYAPNAFTDGPNTTPATSGPFGLWIDQLAPKLGLADPKPFLSGGTNFAVASSETGHNPGFSLSPFPPTVVPNTADQVAIFNLLNLNTASANSLYAFWAGGNDILDALQSAPASAASAGATAADNVAANIRTLAGEGGKYFVWVNMSALGGTPAAQTGGPVAVALANAASVAFNTEEAAQILNLEQSLNVVIVDVDVFSLSSQIAANPGAFGFTDATHSAQGLNGVNPNQFVYWDSIHPTTAADALVADLAFADIATPEPLSAALVLLGLGSVIAARFRFAKPRSGGSLRRDG